MKILMVNKFLYPKGGSETYVLKLGEILQKRGHEVQYFGLQNEKNTVENRVGAYVPDMDFSLGIRKNLTAPFRIIYCAKARRKIRAVLEAFRPDVVHLNNIQFHLTPSIILEIQKYRRQARRAVRIVYTAHDYQLVCPNHSLLNADIQVCEKCLDGQFFHCVKGRCIKNSLPKSILGAADGYVWKWSRAYSYVDAFICPSLFMKQKLDTQKRFRDRTVLLRNFVDDISPKETQKEDYILQFGRLSLDKGTDTLLEAARRRPDIRFVFAGYGPLEKEIAGVPNAEFVGFKTGGELETLIRRARLTVCPSRWYENCPFSVIESQMYGTPVIAARIGGIPELVRQGETGELFEPGNASDLAAKIAMLWDSPGLLAQYTANCRTLSFETPDSYYEKLMKIYGASHG